MELNAWLMYSIVAIATIVSPGPAVLLAINNGMKQGMKSVVISSFGVFIGLFVLSTIIVIGLGAVLKTSNILFSILKFAGASYLIYLGLSKIASKQNTTKNAVQNQLTKNRWQLTREGFLVTVTNPKDAIFFIALFPLFVDSTMATLPQFFILTLTFMTFSFLSLISYGWLSKSIEGFLCSASKMQLFNRVTGCLFIIMGLKILTITHVS